MAQKKNKKNKKRHYDYKREEKKRLEREQKIINKVCIGVGILCVAALVIWGITSFVVRTQEVRGTYVIIGEENYSELEFRYNYWNYITDMQEEAGSVLQLMGLDTDEDLAQQNYSEDQTWEEYFEEKTADWLVERVALKKAVAEAGYEYDTDELYENYVQILETAAAEQDLEFDDYITKRFGEYATLARIEDFIREDLTLNAYYAEVEEEVEITEEEIETYYAAHSMDYDSVDYFLIEIEADIEELSEESEDYEEAFAKAMNLAYTQAKEVLAQIETSGTLYEGMMSDTAEEIAVEWLFDEDRQAGDTAILTDEENASHYVIEFVRRYLDDAPTKNIRMLVATDEDTLNEVMALWEMSDKSEDYFATLANSYSDSQALEGGLYEGLSGSDMVEEVYEWLFEEEREYGDTTTIEITSSYFSVTYFLYYVGENDPAWVYDIRSLLTEQYMEEWIGELSEGIEIVWNSTGT